MKKNPPKIPTIDELLPEINKRIWEKHMIDLPFLPGITISKVEYIENKLPLICSYGEFFDLDTNNSLGKSVNLRIYFIIDNKELATPVLKPNLSWREN